MKGKRGSFLASTLFFLFAIGFAIQGWDSVHKGGGTFVLGFHLVAVSLMIVLGGVFFLQGRNTLA